MMRKKCIRRTLLLLICLPVLAAVAGAQPGKRQKPAQEPRHLYQVYRDEHPYGRRCGFIDNTGKLVINFDWLPLTTGHVGEFHDGRAVIYLKKSEGKEFTGYRMGYIDETGQIIIAPRFDYARDFSEGLAYVEREGFHGFIDRQGKPVINLAPLAADFQVEASVLQAREFHEGLAAVGTGRWGGPSYYNDNNSSQWGGMWGYINRSGKLVIKPQFRFADSFSEGLAGVVTDNERAYGFINKTGQMVIQPRFQPRPGGPHGFGIGGTSRFSEGLARVQDAGGLYGAYGYIDKKGDYRIPPQFYSAEDFSEGVAWVITRDQKGGLIDKSGQWLITGMNGRSFSEGLAPFAVYSGKDYLWGYMDHSGKEVIKPQFGSASQFIGGIAQVSAIHENGIYGFIDKQGQYVWKSQ